MQYLCYTVVTLKGADNMTIGQRIKARRLELCMNAETLAEKVGVGAVPGSAFFNIPEYRYIRLHFAKSEDMLNQALNKLEKMKSLM